MLFELHLTICKLSFNLIYIELGLNLSGCRQNLLHFDFQILFKFTLAGRVLSEPRTLLYEHCGWLFSIGVEAIRLDVHLCDQCERLLLFSVVFAIIGRRVNRFYCLQFLQALAVCRLVFSGSRWLWAGFIFARWLHSLIEIDLLDALFW